MFNLHSVMIGSNHVRALGKFYAQVLARPAEMVEEGKEYGWKLGNSFFVVGEHSAMPGTSKEPGRIMVNFETTQVNEEFERIRAAGAVVIREPYEMAGMWVATFADPDGNYFQLMTPFKLPAA